MTDLKIRAKSYWRRRYAVAALGLAVLLLFLAAFQFTGASQRLKAYAESVTGSYYLQVLIYLSVFGILTYIVTLPVDIYGGFVLEHKYSLSNQTIIGWALDELKKASISSVLSVSVIMIIYWVVMNFGNSWWIVASAVCIALSLLFANLFPLCILPLFYKYKPLPDNALRNKCLDLAERFRINVVQIYEIDYSRTTRKSNAAVVRWGNSRRIVMADNLINEFDADEVVAVLAHELAHHKMSHMWVLMSVSALSTVILFALINYLGGGISAISGVKAIGDVSAFPVLYLVVTLYGVTAAPIYNMISRKLETDADAMAIKMTGSPGAFITLMESLGRKNLSDIEPNRLIEYLLYSHPSISSRIRSAREFQDEQHKH